MVVTLDVSKLSGWLNADASCRVERRGERGRHAGLGRQEGVGAAAQAACREGASCGGSLASGARAEHTENMYDMSVTLDVLKLSGWLNAVAYCRVWKGRGGGMCAGPGRREGVGAAAQASCR